MHVDLLVFVFKTGDPDVFSEGTEAGWVPRSSSVALLTISLALSRADRGSAAGEGARPTLELSQA